MLLILLVLYVHEVRAEAAIAIVGRASVVDGDTIEIRGQRIRLAGMDAFESRQLCLDVSGKRYRCGQRAAFALADHIRQRNVTCEPVGKSWERIVALCTLDGEDLGAWLVQQGWAVDDPRYWPAYQRQEAAARSASAGAWSGSFDRPQMWRKAH